jgi:metal-sulfur cluster biosynthetic enzyme
VAEPGPAAAPARPPDTPSDQRAESVRGALLEVIDPDLGVNIVDLGFVRQVEIQDRMAVITMTLTSAACPLTSIMEDQIRAELAGLSDLAGFRIDWVWLPPWRPADITDSGRDQLRAIGFSL